MTCVYLVKLVVLVVAAAQVGVAQQASHYANTVNGVTTGECAYINGHGQSIKVTRIDRLSPCKEK